jgi:serine phosphatase RsbU (regulator of sigma subunit)
VAGTASRTAQVAWLLAGAGLVFGLWLATGSYSGITFFFVVPIGLAAWWFGLSAGIGAAALCTGLFLLGGEIQHIPEFGVSLAVRVLAFFSAALLASALRERLLLLEHSAEELEAIRAALAPSELPEIPGVDAAAAFVPSELGVSGDFYLLTNGPDGSTVAIVGDVVGHGPKAARLATFIRARFAAFAANTSDPAELLTLANGALVDRPGREQELITAICLRFRATEETISWSVAGHPPPLWLPDLESFSTQSTTFLLGADPRIELVNVESQREGHEGVLVYTDGATDVKRGGERLGLDGLARLLRPHSGLSARAMIAEVERAILEWADRPIRDDLCLLALKPEGPESGVLGF